jgi:hypothetical protein
MKAMRRSKRNRKGSAAKKSRSHAHRCQACGRVVRHGDGDCVALFGSIRLVANGCNNCNGWSPQQWEAHQAEIR